jgi:hypothetical protein
MRLEQIMAWQPISPIRLAKTEKDPRKPRAPQQERGLSEGDVHAVDPARRQAGYETPSEAHSVDIKV